jgi:TadE-like protein
MTARPMVGGRKRSRGGQGLVEFAILLPVFMVVLFGMLEFGLAFSHHLTLEYATREGARIGAALGNGTNKIPPCAQTRPEDVDELIVAAVQRVLTSPGSQIPPAQVGEIRIYKANSTGGESGGLVNVWVPGSDGKTVDGVLLEFKPTSQPWKACDRKALTGTTDPDTIGVSLTYDYQAITPLGTLLGIAGADTLRITDRTIMAVEPFTDG